MRKQLENALAAAALMLFIVLCLTIATVADAAQLYVTGATTVVVDDPACPGWTIYNVDAGKQAAVCTGDPLPPVPPVIPPEPPTDDCPPLPLNHKKSIWNWANQEQKVHLPLKGSESFSVSFLPRDGAFGSFSTVESVMGSAARYVTISTCPGDLSSDKVVCSQNGSKLGAGLSFWDQPRNGTCLLNPGESYHFNVWHWDPIAGDTCTGICYFHGTWKHD